MDLVLPHSTVALIGKVSLKERHSGLQLDKYSIGGEQTQQKAALEKVCQTVGDKDFLKLLSQRRKKMLEAMSGDSFTCTTAGPLTLHLSRASALENAGICLHPLYGFVYLPGSGLKGMARAYAETVAGASPDEIEEVFGNKPGEPKKEKQRAGAIVFHDAWPMEWPKLIVDIVNNHHPGYYQADPTDNAHPPGDWENPNPVYFLAVPPGATFQFVLSLRRSDARSELLQRAKEWLMGALCHLGAGAKTAAGYGSFRPVHESLPQLPSSREPFEATLELVTPAFLAGANQRAEDCELRPATVRGLLRWWWRSFHVGFVDVALLRQLEAAVWGDTVSGGAVRVVVTPLPGNPKPELCSFKKLSKDKKNRDIIVFDPSFSNKHGLQKAPDKTTQGLAYSAYGMDEMPAGKLQERRRRWYAPPGTKWQVRLIARASKYGDHCLDAKLILGQAKLALWWLCYLGGVGSKARHGFGSFADLPELADFDGVRWLTLSKPFRAACGLPEGDFEASRVSSLSLGQMRNLAHALDMNPCLQIATSWSDPWRVLDEIGATIQSFAQASATSGHGKHCDAKRHLGLPRKIHGPLSKPLPHQSVWQAPLELQGAHGNRHASPFWYHVAKGQSGLVVRVGAFPAASTRAPGVDPAVGWQESRQLLEKLLLHVQQKLI